MASDANAEKYDRLADDYSSRYADREAIAAHQLELITGWGYPVHAGSNVLEIGCADGFATSLFGRAGLRVTALDFSPAMVTETRRRLARDQVSAATVVADVNSYEPTEDFDVIVCLMWTFFHYANEPAVVLRRLAPHARVKLLVDVNPREVRVADAVEAVRRAGFDVVSWRPFLVPQRVRVPRGIRRLLFLAERIPGLRSLPLRRKFSVVVLGQRSTRG